MKSKHQLYKQVTADGRTAYGPAVLLSDWNSSDSFPVDRLVVVYFIHLANSMITLPPCSCLLL